MLTYTHEAFNRLARVYRHNSEPESTITIDFHDKKTHPMIFKDDKQLYLSSISDNGVFFGCDGESTNTDSFLEFKSFPSHHDSCDWSIELKNGENVKGAIKIGQSVRCNSALIAKEIFCI